MRWPTKNWLCFARPAPWQNRPARQLDFPQTSQISQVWLRFAYSSNCLQPRRGKLALFRTPAHVCHCRHPSINPQSEIDNPRSQGPRPTIGFVSEAAPTHPSLITSFLTNSWRRRSRPSIGFVSHSRLPVEPSRMQYQFFPKHPIHPRFGFVLRNKPRSQ